MNSLPFSLLRGGLILLATALSTGRLSGQATLVNVDPAQNPALVQALQGKGLTATAGGPNLEITPATRLIVWEAKADGADLLPEKARQVAEFVRRGGSLLLSLGERPGIAPLRLAFMLPTIPWESQTAGSNNAAPHLGVSALNWDPAFFHKDEPAGLRVPFHFPLSPLTANERGMGRYDPYAYHIPAFELEHKPGEFYWTRPLLNREWTVRLRVGDREQTPLLITGRYGAGRVAVFASTVAGDAPPLQKVCAGVVDWLTAPVPAGSAAGPLEVQVAPAPVVDGGHQSLVVTVRNPAATPASGTVLARFLTWEEALVQDGQGAFTVAARAQTTVLIPFPTLGPTGYQALDFKDAFDVRVGLLSADGSTLVAETRQAVDLEPPVTLSVATDNLRAIPYPYEAPDHDALGSMRARMGMPVMNYAYKPGAQVNASVTLTGGVRNLASLAAVEDETQPGNVTAAAVGLNASQMEKATRGEFGANGTWTGKAEVENVLRFTFPRPVQVSAVVLNGSPTDFRMRLRNNPGAVVIECDGKPVAHEEHLDARFVSDFGLVRIAFPPVTGRVWRVRLPWPAEMPTDRSRLEPRLGGILIEGTAGVFPPAQSGVVSLTLHDSMTGVDTPVGQQPVSVEPGTTRVVPFTFSLPKNEATAFYRLEASFQGMKKAVPVLAIQPTKTLRPVTETKPEGALHLTFTVSGGFRNGSGIGTGTQESHSSWSSPDDLVWAFSRGLKQTGVGRAMPAGMLFSMNDGISHYCNPWTCFRNGEPFFSVAAPQYLHALQKRNDWATNPNVTFGFSDRWDSGPSLSSMYTWQDFVGFDQYLRRQGKAGLKGQTHTQIAREIDTTLSGQWQKWQTDRYVQNVETLRQTFAAQGKKFSFSGQGIPVTTADAGKIVAQTVRGMSDDNTWGMWDNDVIKTDGRQLAYMAYNPWWALNYNFVWGWNSSTLNNFYWFAPVGTTEPSRRHQAERSWRATIDGDGGYRSMYTYGYGMNGGSSYCMTLNDWQQNWQAQERQSLIYPDGPIGAGLIVGTGVMENPDSALFSGGGMGDSPAEKKVTAAIAPVFANLQRAGLSIPFVASTASVSRWKGHSPLIVADLSVFTPGEVAILKRFIDAGVPVAAFRGPGNLSENAAALFGVSPDGTPRGGQPVGRMGPAAIVANGAALFINADAHTIPPDDLRAVGPLLSNHLRLPIKFPEGTTGYGFTVGPLAYYVVEDWLDEGRPVTLRVRAGAGQKARAVNVNDHQPLAVHRDKDEWVIDVPMRPGDGALIALSETF